MNINTEKNITIGMLIFPKMTSLDILGPFEVLAKAPGCTVQFVWKDMSAVVGDTGIRVMPDVDFNAAPKFDVIVVPGGPGQTDLMEDEDVISFLTTQGSQAKFVTSVCTGSLLLAAAGLLTGYKATCHWLSIDQLTQFGVEVVEERVVIDRNRITGGGVTSGLDFAFAVLSVLRGEDCARTLQLLLEYDPQPPFNSGHPRSASKELVAQVRLATASMVDRRSTVSNRVAARLNARRANQ